MKYPTTIIILLPTFSELHSQAVLGNLLKNN